MLSITRLNLPWDSVVKPSDSGCDCSSEMGIPTILGFASTKKSDEWHKLFGPDFVVLTQHIETRTLAPWPSLKTKIQRASGSIVRSDFMPSNIERECKETLM